MKKLMILCVAAFAMLAVSCTKDATSFSGTTYEAKYTKSVNNVVAQVVSQIFFTSETDLKITAKVIIDGKVITEDTGASTYVVEGDKMIMDNGATVLIISGNTLKRTNEGTTIIFKKK